MQIWKSAQWAALSTHMVCLGWSTPTFRTLLAVAGTFEFQGGGSALLSRFGEVSALLKVRYWSTTDKQWLPLVLAAVGLTKDSAGEPRGDFTSAELLRGQDLYFSQKDGRTGNDVTYRMRVRESGHDRFVLETENATPVRWLGLTLLKSGDVQSVYFLDQRSPGIWSYYALTKISGGSFLLTGHDNSYINRGVALYRHFAGIQTDLMPPPAP